MQNPQPHKRHGSLTASLLRGLYHSGLLGLAHAARPNRLTVLNYHRIANPHQADFLGYPPMASATPAAFAEQMAFVARHYQVIDLDRLLAWLRGEARLPRHPLLITFDDGYRDNYTNALPVLRQFGLPAVLFVTCGCIESTQPFYWDLIAHCFRETRLTQAKLPMLGVVSWRTNEEKTALADRLIHRLKQIPESEKQQALASLPQRLEVIVADGTFASLHLSWAELQAMADAGIAIGAHTQTHPILTRLPLPQAREEITACKHQLEQRLHRPVNAFAYTNGQRGDFNDDIKALLRNNSFEAAFTLLPGPAKIAEVRRDALAIPRIYIGRNDDLPRFVVKMMGERHLKFMGQQ